MIPKYGVQDVYLVTDTGFILGLQEGDGCIAVWHWIHTLNVCIQCKRVKNVKG